jgi:hypothetical protein
MKAHSAPAFCVAQTMTTTSNPGMILSPDGESEANNNREFIPVKHFNIFILLILLNIGPHTPD